MPTCFVMQPFDRGTFDKRYADVFEPAIRRAGLEPYRVDKDPSSSIPIDAIEAGIRNAEVCFAEITTDNPNVWFELGFAIALDKHVVLVCSDQRTSRFPFDVQHRTIISYKTESVSDYEALGEAITARIAALRKKSARVEAAAEASLLTPTEGLSDHEIVALISVAVGTNAPGDGVTAWSIKHSCERVGYTQIAVALALRSLAKRGYIVLDTEVDNNGEEYPVYRGTPEGLDWLEANKERLILRHKPKPAEPDPDVPF